jgi:hypothetical protein
MASSREEMKYWLDADDASRERIGFCPTAAADENAMLKRALETSRLAYAKSQKRYHEALKRVVELERELPPMSEAKVLRQVDVMLCAQAFVRMLGRKYSVEDYEVRTKQLVQSCRELWSVEHAMAFGEAGELDSDRIELEIRGRHG